MVRIRRGIGVIIALHVERGEAELSHIVAADSAPWRPGANHPWRVVTAFISVRMRRPLPVPAMPSSLPSDHMKTLG